MPVESVDDSRQRATESEPRGAELAAEIDRLWDDLRRDPRSADDGDAASDDSAEETPTAAIERVVEPPAGASQSAVEEAVIEAETDTGSRSREDTGSDHLSI
ncbi:hypothetical protein [Halorientalis sp.]|jgi:hypothetical protein|uniref:hypothetical protein n=1 Tax=Halorientalis sp. TaxID=1931229 RepID=UPI00262776C8|nr:hypothetical protein [Halorientalis sp.]